MALGLFKQQQAARATANQQLSGHGCSKAASAAQLLKAAEVHGTAAAWEHLADEDEGAWSSDSMLSEGLLADGAVPGGRGGMRRSRKRGGVGQRSSRSDLKDVPFGMLVLEVLLDATAGEARGGQEE